MENTCKITAVNDAAEGVLSLLVEQPWRLKLGLGQVADVAVVSGAAEGRRATLPLLAGGDKQEMELLTGAFAGAQAGDALEITNVREALTYRGAGKFLVEGDGIGLGLGIARWLRHQNRLKGHDFFESRLADHYFYYQAPTLAALVARTELRNMFGGHFEGALTAERQPGYWFGRIGEDFILHVPREINHEFYLAGGQAFLDEATAAIKFYGAAEDKIQTVPLGAAEVAA